MIKRIISGGQTGADRAALDAASNWVSPMVGRSQKAVKQKMGPCLTDTNLRRCPPIVILPGRNKTLSIQTAL
jgi:hypothetical protein